MSNTIVGSSGWRQDVTPGNLVETEIAKFISKDALDCELDVADTKNSGAIVEDDDGGEDELKETLNKRGLRAEIVSKKFISIEENSAEPMKNAVESIITSDITASENDLSPKKYKVEEGNGLERHKSRETLRSEDVVDTSYEHYENENEDEKFHQVDEITEEVDALLISKEDYNEEVCLKRLGEIRSSDSDLMLTLHDYGGQPIFYSMHHLFIKRNSLYCIVFNMFELMEQKKKTGNGTSLGFLKSWIDAIMVHTLSKDANDTATVAFVGTHKDKCPDEGQHDYFSNMIYELIEGTPVIHKTIRNPLGVGRQGTTTHFFFPVDNLQGVKDTIFVELMKRITASVGKELFVTQRRPIAWMRCVDMFTEQLTTHKKMHLTYADASEIARLAGVSDSDFDNLLKFLNQMSVVMWFNEGELLRNVIILDVFGYLVKAICTVICKHQPTANDSTSHSSEASERCQRLMPQDWNEFMKAARISEKLLHGLLEDWETQKAVIIALMCKFTLLVPLKDESDEISDGFFLVPSLLREPPRKFECFQNFRPDRERSVCMILLSTGKLICDNELSVDSQIKDCLFPMGIFPRLLGKIVCHCQQFPENSFGTMKIYLREITARMGNQKFRLSEHLEEKFIRLEVEGDFAISVIEVIEGLVRNCLQETMPSLTCTTVLPLMSDGDKIGTFLPLDKVRQHIVRGLKGDYCTQDHGDLTPEDLRSKFSPFLPLGDVKEYDVMISYRWGEFDSALVTDIYGGFLRFVIGNTNRQIHVFLDRDRLKKGENFQDSFAKALMNSLLIMPILSACALEKVQVHDPDVEDNMLIEWMLCIECLKISTCRVSKIVPVIFGEVDMEGALGKIDTHLHKLSKTTIVPSKSIAKVKLLMEGAGFTPSPELEGYTVYEIVDHIHKCLGVLISSPMNPLHRISAICEGALGALNDPKLIDLVNSANCTHSSNKKKFVEEKREKAAAGRFEEAWKILQISDNCRKGKFDELSEYLKDDLGVENSEQLKECKIQKHQKISEYLKGRLEDKYMDLVSASTPR